MVKVKPLDAYIARLMPNGDVIVGDLDDPKAVLVVVVEFTQNTYYYNGLYHDGLDMWEIIPQDHRDNHIQAFVNHDYYKVCERVAAKYTGKLLAGPCPRAFERRLTDLMAAEIQAEMDGEIIKDLQMASGFVPEVSLQVQAITIDNKPRKLKAVWSVDIDETKKPRPMFKSMIVTQ